jgi:glyoxylate/hydroxypyruvate reductase A
MAVVLFRSSPGSVARWRPHLQQLIPEHEFRFAPEIGNRADITYALVWQPEPNLLASLPNLKLIINLGAGVDGLLRDQTLPRHLPIMRHVDPHMTDAMSEYVVCQVMRLHRQDLDYMAQQRAHVWEELTQINAADRRVGILGFGTLGQEAGRKLKALGFDVAGWGRTAKDIPGFATYAGEAGFNAFLACTDILVCLLPLTAATENILNADTFSRLPPGAMLVNAGRGNHLVEDDLIPAIASGRLSGAVLDVFRTEPLPPDHPFWDHPRIIVTPHIAAETNPPTAAAIVREAIGRFEAGLPVDNLVDPAQGY